MRTRTLIATYGLLFITLLGIAVVIVQTEPPLTVKAAVTPFMISLEDPAPDEFKLRITNIPSPYKPENINATTVRIDGVLPIIFRDETEWECQSPKYKKDRFEAQLHGPSMVWLIRSKAGHLTPGVMTPVTLAVTGKFNDGIQFEGSLEVTIMLPDADPPPPP